jgi:Peptidase inhibitor family I36.
MRKHIAIAAIGVLTLGISLTSGSPALAASPSVTVFCPEGFVCLYDNSSFGGNEILVDSGLSFANFSTQQFNDKMSSWFNNTNRNYCWFYDVNFSGTKRSMAARSDNPFVGSLDNDKASSLAPC